MLSLPVYVFIDHWQNLKEVKMIYWTNKNGSQFQWDYLQCSEFGHMVETCHRQSSDVVIVESAVRWKRSILTHYSYVTFAILFKNA